MTSMFIWSALKYFVLGTSQPSGSTACLKPSPKTHLKLPVYASNLQHNHSEVVACGFGGHAVSRRLTKQSGTWLGRARWVSDKLCRVTWSVALHSLPVKYSWLLFRHCPPSPLKMDLEHFFPRFRTVVWFSSLQTPERGFHTSASTGSTVLKGVASCLRRIIWFFSDQTNTEMSVIEGA